MEPFFVNGTEESPNSFTFIEKRVLNLIESNVLLLRHHNNGMCLDETKCELKVICKRYEVETNVPIDISVCQNNKTSVKRFGFTILNI